jgi:O-antigen/teichoic acid export membrane protein
MERVLLLSSLLNTICNNLYPLVIGKKYSAIDLGYYSKASSYADFPVKTFYGVFGTVSFPVLCSIQDDDERLRNAYRRLIRVSGYIVFPLLMGLAALAKPFVLVLITEKWAVSIPYLVIICFSSMWSPIHSLNLNLLQIKGRSDLFLRLEIFKKVLSLVVLIITMNISLMAMCVGTVITSYLCLYINTFYTGKLINVGFFMQMKDLIPSFAFAVSMGVVVYATTFIIPNLILQIVFGIIIGIAYYLVVSILFKSSELAYVKLLLRENVFKRYGKK